MKPLADGFYLTCSIYDSVCSFCRTIEVLNGVVIVNNTKFTQEDFFSVNKLRHD